MKEYYCITILALLVVTLLQGYNVSLQYKEYIYKEASRKSVSSALKRLLIRWRRWREK